MNTDKHRYKFNQFGFICVYLCSSVVPILLSGCVDKVSKANVDLRKQVQAKNTEIETLKRGRVADAATIQSLQQQRGTLQTLPQERLEKLYTVHGLMLGRLTGSYDEDTDRIGGDGVKVHAIPVDEMGDSLKASGSFVVELFDLNKTSDNIVGRWEFTAEQSRQSWYGRALLYEYILKCPWKRAPEHNQLTIKVTFRDELTQREFSVQKIVTVDGPVPIQ